MKHSKPLATALVAAVALAFSAPASAETIETVYSFDETDIFLNNWINPIDSSEFIGFRIGTSIFDDFAGEMPSAVAGDIGFTAFAAAEYKWDNSTIVFGFTDSPDKTYTVDWANSWLDVDADNDGVLEQISLKNVILAQADAGLAADIWGGGGLNPATTWFFDVSAEITTIKGGSIAYSVTSVPEPETWAMLLAGLGIMGATARRRARQS
ncbi:MAG: PEPxxWA-CTERM sorting domain-containing protein [Azoarcus sp.]|jgi:hypothetical protein|nr:PEPxxWA-CTERM sorting domain-containing protein [Azoarcus sp.]